MAKTNVIDMTERRKQQLSGETEKSHYVGSVTDMTERRMEALNEERRQTRRTILTEFIGAFIVVPQSGLKKVALFDISDNGLSFDIEFEFGHLEIGEELAMRVYLSQFTYFPFTVKINNLRHIPEEGVYRHGVSFLKETLNEEALHHFVKFIENVSIDLHRDNGDKMSSGYNRK